MNNSTLDTQAANHKLPQLIWLAFAYGLRHFFILAFPFASKNFDNFFELFSSPIYAISDVLVLLIIYANMHREPEAGSFIRKIWKHAKLVLFIAFTFDLALTAIKHYDILTNTWNHQFGLVAGTVCIDALIIVYVMVSRKLKEVFNDFPDRKFSYPLPTNNKYTPETLTKAPRSNIPNEKLITAEIVAGYRYEGYPFPTKDTADPLVRIRDHILNNRFGLAEKGLRFLIEKSPDNSLYWHELGWLALQLEKLEQAEAFTLRAVLLDPRNSIYLRNLGEIRRRLGYFEDAIKSTRRALEINPTDATAHYNLGLALWDNGNKEQAQIAFEDAKTYLG